MENSAAKVVAAIVGGILVVALIVYGSFALYEGSWSLASHSLKHQGELQRQALDQQGHNISHSYQVQSGYVTQIGDDVSQIDQLAITMPGNPNSAAMRTQAIQLGIAACGLAVKLDGSVPEGTGMPAWIKTNCSVGTLSPSSPIYSGKGN